TWVILQPPPVRGVSEAELIRFFGAVADKAEIPVGLQIAPEYLGVDMSYGALAELARQHANVALLKMEITPLDAARLVNETDGMFDVFNGRAGQEMTDALRAGCVGIIPGGESADVLARIYELLKQDTSEAKIEADRQYRDIAPLVTFLEGSMDTLLIYGKRIAARRFGLGPERARARAPCASATEFGLSLAERLSTELKPL
ncbi:MAG: dihydrodipicolinate synthase family protein, partial [Gammaproteobacteria bacterium]|nr:dihydrodipicolinate synthase family protein [Gammaproteobacteria bacterium]